MAELEDTHWNHWSNFNFRFAQDMREALTEAGIKLSDNQANAAKHAAVSAIQADVFGWPTASVMGHSRLQTHMRLARIDTAEAVDLIEAELEDRFGALPPEAVALLAQTRLRALAARVGLARVVAGPRGIVLHPAPGAAVVPADGGLGDVIERRDDVLVCPEAIEDPVQRMARAADLLERLAAAREAPVGASLPDPAPTDAG